MARRVALYIHLVVDDPAALAERRVQLSEYAQAQGYEIALVADDTGPSDKPDRPGLGQILAAAEAGEFDVLMMLDPWELQGSLAQFRTCYLHLFRDCGVELACVRHAVCGEDGEAWAN